MQYALVNGIKVEASKGLMGSCPACSHVVFPKCGKININHWAHRHKKNCDPWWEPETKWHRDWKNHFPFEYREVVLKNEDNSEFHRADIHTRKGITIEFQNSPISVDQLRNRENFYSKLIWVVNVKKCKERFALTKRISDPENVLSRGLEFVSPETGMYFYKKSELSNWPKCMPLDLSDVLPISDFHFLFNWKNKPKVWFCSTADIFLDFGEDILYQLREHKQTLLSFWYLEEVKKTEFIYKHSK